MKTSWRCLCSTIVTYGHSLPHKNLPHKSCVFICTSLSLSLYDQQKSRTINEVESKTSLGKMVFIWNYVNKVAGYFIMLTDVSDQTH